MFYLRFGIDMPVQLFFGFQFTEETRFSGKIGNSLSSSAVCDSFVKYAGKGFSLSYETCAKKNFDVRLCISRPMFS